MTSWSSVKVLVVDDTASQRYARARFIAGAGFQVVQASCGREALGLADSVDVVVLDVFLPDIDGFEVCRSLRQHPRTALLPIIHVSAVFVADAHATAGAHAGADAYLIEPVPPEVLIQVIMSTFAARAAAGQDQRAA